MYYAEIKGYLSADYRFGSDSFKWVYYSSIKFARHILYKYHMDEYYCIVIRFSTGIRIAVDQYGMTIDDNRRAFNIVKEGK